MRSSFFYILLVIALPSFATIAIKSPPNQIHLLELFSSEGCSSCPPADRWITTLIDNPQLWKTFVPLNFHVDYWNRLGWVDRFSRDQFTKRQRDYSAHWGTKSVYTPGFVLDGKEFKGAFGRDKSYETIGPSAGVISITEKPAGNFLMEFAPEASANKKYLLHAALLGHGLTSKILAGENKGRTLQHDFVVLAQSTSEAPVSAGKARASFAFSLSGKGKPTSSAVAFWVTATDSPVPIQAVGSPL